VWLGRLKAAATRVRAATEPSGASERIVGIPEIAVFSELPFAHLGVIGGAEANIVANSSAAPGKAVKKSAPKKSLNSRKAKKPKKKTAKRKTAA
jgi:hypothetical protein